MHVWTKDGLIKSTREDAIAAALLFVPIGVNCHVVAGYSLYNYDLWTKLVNNSNDLFYRNGDKIAEYNQIDFNTFSFQIRCTVLLSGKLLHFFK